MNANGDTTPQAAAPSPLASTSSSTSSTSSVDEAAVLVLEYEQLKKEQTTRIGHRDGLVYTTLAAVAAATAAAVSARNLALLLLLPPVSVLLGWTHLDNDIKVSAMGRYVRESLAGRLTELSGASEPVFGWEIALRANRRRRAHKWMQLLVNLVMVTLIPFAALMVFWVQQPVQVGLLLVSIAEALLVLTLAVFVVIEADAGPARPVAAPNQADDGGL